MSLRRIRAQRLPPRPARDPARSADSLRRHVAHRLPPLVERARRARGRARPRASRASARRRPRAPRGERDRQAGTGRARRDRGAPSARARAQTAPAAVIQSLRSGSAQTAIDAGRPGRRTRRTSANARLDVVDEHQAEAAEDAVHRCVGEVDRGGIEHAEVDVRRARARLHGAAPPRPSPARRRWRAGARPARGAPRRGSRCPRALRQARGSSRRAAGRAARPCAPRASAWRPRTGPPSLPAACDAAPGLDDPRDAALTRRRPRTAG